jgi:hypothetical protein
MIETIVPYGCGRVKGSKSIQSYLFSLSLHLYYIIRTWWENGWKSHKNKNKKSVKICLDAGNEQKNMDGVSGWKSEKSVRVTKEN